MGRRVLSACAVAAMLAAGFGVPACAVPAAAEGALRVEIVDVGSPVASEFEPLRVAATVTNEGSGEVVLSGASLMVQSAAPSTRTHLLDFLAGADSPMREVSSTIQLSRLAAGASERYEFSLPASALARERSDWGPRGLEVRVAVGDGAGGAGSDSPWVSDRSLAVLAPSEDVEPVATGVVVPLTASSGELGALPGLEGLLAGETSGVPARVSALADLGGPGVTLVAEPAFAEAAQASGAVQTLAAPAFDADVAALVHAGAKDTALELLRKSGTVVSLAAPGVDSQTAEVLAQAGAEAMIVSSDDVSTSGGDYATPCTHSRLSGEGLDMLVVDAASSSALAGSLSASARYSAGADETRLSALDSRQLVLALSAMTYLEQPATIRPQLVAVDRANVRQYGMGVPGDAASDSPLAVGNLDATIDALMAAPWVRPASVSELLGTEVSSARRAVSDVAVAAGEIPARTVRLLEEGRAKAERLEPLLASPDVLSVPVDAAVSRAWSVAWRSDPSVRASYAKETEAALSDLSDAVHPVSSSTINVIAERTEIPARVQNALPFPVNVQVELDSVSARLTAGAPVSVELAPASTTTVKVPVTARGSGDVDARIRLRTPVGARFGADASIDVRVRAQWENWATFALGLVSALALVFGAWNSFRKKGPRSRPITVTEYSTARRADARRRKSRNAYPKVHSTLESGSGLSH